MPKKKEPATEHSIIRSPITVILGHVDSGKTSLLDKVRGTAVQAREAGGITQHIGASFFPRGTIEALAGDLLKGLKGKLEIPGILIIDTPGHAAFVNLRSRGASIANFAILVIDIIRGVQPQTIESLRLLIRRKVPFFVALNKIDRVPGWKPTPNAPITLSLKKQTSHVLQYVDNKIYEIMEVFSKFKLECDRFDRIKDYRTRVAIIPTSAVTGEGIPEMFLLLAGLSQQYLKSQLILHATEAAKGTVLEVKKESGLGTTLDVIIYDGVIKTDDEFVVLTMEGPTTSRVKGLYIPETLDEIRDPRRPFKRVEHVIAAAGVKVVGPELDHVIAGSPLYVLKTEEDKEKYMKEMQEEIKSIIIETDQAGVIVKADTLGSLEALINFLRDNGVPIRKASIGPINKMDILEAEIARDMNPEHGVILAFRVEVHPEAKDNFEKSKIKLIKDEIIYQIHDDYRAWIQEIRDQQEREKLKDYVRPAKIRVLPYVFRQSNPAIVGVRVEAGTLTTRVNIINESNRRVGQVLQMQDRGENIHEARVGQEVAVSIKGPTVGRQLKVDHYYYVDVPESHAKKILKELRDLVNPTELEALEELIAIKRRNEKPTWAL